jgi:hypothetical protein
MGENAFGRGDRRAATESDDAGVRRAQWDEAVRVGIGGQDDAERLSRRGALLRRRRAAVERPGGLDDLEPYADQRTPVLGLAITGAVCLAVGLGAGYLMWGTRTMELAAEVAHLKRAMAEQASQAMAEWAELEAKLRDAKLELERAAPRMPSPRDELGSSMPAPGTIPGAAPKEDSETRRSTSDRPPRSAPLELPRRRPDPPPELSGSLTSPRVP